MPDGRGKSETSLASSPSSPAISRRSPPTPRRSACATMPRCCRSPEGQELVATCDTIVAGVHFLTDDPPDTIGYKALAVNLSDLAAKGARPYVYLLALALPDLPKPPWLEAFASGLRRLQEEAGIDLVGGDTCATLGPLTITITALGLRAARPCRCCAGAPRRATVSMSAAPSAMRPRASPAAGAMACRWHGDFRRMRTRFLVGRYRCP